MNFINLSAFTFQQMGNVEHCLKRNITEVVLTAIGFRVYVVLDQLAYILLSVCYERPLMPKLESVLSFVIDLEEENLILCCFVSRLGLYVEDNNYSRLIYVVSRTSVV